MSSSRQLTTCRALQRMIRRGCMESNSSTINSKRVENGKLESGFGLSSTPKSMLIKSHSTYSTTRWARVPIVSYGSSP